MHALAAMTLYLLLFFVHAANAETHSLFAHSLYSIFEMNGVNLSKHFWCTGVRDQVLSVCVCVCVGKSVFGVPLVMIYSMDQHSNRKATKRETE